MLASARSLLLFWEAAAVLCSLVHLMPVESEMAIAAVPRPAATATHSPYWHRRDVMLQHPTTLDAMCKVADVADAPVLPLTDTATTTGNERTTIQLVIPDNARPHSAPSRRRRRGRGAGRRAWTVEQPTDDVTTAIDNATLHGRPPQQRTCLAVIADSAQQHWRCARNAVSPATLHNVPIFSL